MRKNAGIRWGIFILALFILFSIPSVLFARDTQAAQDSAAQAFKGYPVDPFGNILFYVKTRIGPYKPEGRAKRTTEDIRELANDPFFRTDSLEIVHEDDDVDIVYGEKIVTSVTQADSKAENKPSELIASERHKAISAAVNEQIKLNSEAGILKSILFSGLILVILTLLIYLVNKIYHFLDKRIPEFKSGFLSRMKIRDVPIIPVRNQIQILHIFNQVTRYVLILLFFVTALWLTSYLLPWTKLYSLMFLKFILRPLGNFFRSIWFFIPNLLTIIVICFITTMIVKLFRFFKNEIEQGDIKLRGFFPEWALPVFNIIRFLVWAFAIILIYPHLPGSDSKVFQGVSVLIGLLFSITSASILGNLVAGFALTFTRAFQIGDRIKVGDNIGDVVEKTMAVTKIRTIKNEIITIPNGKISNSEVVNYTTLEKEGGLILHTTVTIGYDAPWRQIHKLLIEAAKATELVLSEPEPFVFQTSLDDFYVSYQVNAYTRDSHQMAVIMSNLHLNIQESFNKAGVEIMSPHYRALREGNRIAIPDDYIPKEYITPGFNVKTGEK
ncbi:MAG: mechanosensitive ion channel family protein [Bacteroidetes bacterium]|nr:mechanosensitive ion channel family protein [Bacteroidota bacterium]